ncbi:MAG: ATPase, T2SS/T4P/T4SS family [Thermincola sp.]|jgi:pilus assembly protein CpaF|nr:ATPase, T2SS/T4P/T4SS family [Thermincola sp.]MDT3701468.1 ATPase, T2SS/T4P/T4SS family [Thermincola sp.]
MHIGETEAFDIGQYIAENRLQHEDEASVQQRTLKKAALYLRCENFLDLCKNLYHHFEMVYDQNTDPKRSMERLELQHRAIIGDPRAVKIFKDEIAEFIRANNLSNTGFPQCYTDLPGAVFQEVYGWGPLARWWDEPRSQSALVLGTQIFYDGVLQNERFSSPDRVWELIHSLCLKDAASRINSHQPDLEVEMYDGTRVSISIPPRGLEYEITFRKFILEDFSLENLVHLGTIPEEALPVFQGLARGLPNTLFVGPVRSGKSHTLKAFVHERFMERSYTVVSMETHFELALRKMLPFEPIIEKQAREDELHEIFKTVLRKDLDFGIMGEIRGIEAECAMLLCERGTKGFLGTFHISRPHNIPGSWARLILDKFPNRNYAAELMRVADNIDIVLVQEELSDRSKKRIKSVVELRFDPLTLQVSTHEIMRYSPADDRWGFRFDLSNSLLERMAAASPKSVKPMIQCLKRLEDENPIAGPNQIICSEVMR